MKHAGTLAILVPILILVGWVAKLEISGQTGTKVRVRVEGYDPRDLLSGHYVRFTISPGGTNPCGTSRAEGDAQSKGSQGNRCLCFGRETGSSYHVPYWGGSCDERPVSCKGFLRGSCSWSTFMSGVERYSIPERLSPVLLQIPPESSVLLSLDGDGGALVSGMMVGEESIEVYAQRQLESGAVTPMPSIPATP